MQQAQRNGGMDKKQQKISTPKSLIHVTQMSNNCNMLTAQRNGQRIYGGPPEGWAGPAPSR